MSYALSGPLQAAVFAALSADTSLGAVVGTAIYDAIPSGSLPPIYVSLGSEEAFDASDKTGNGALHKFKVTVVTESPGFALAKTAAAAISDVLHNADLTLSRGRLVYLHFERARALLIDTADIRKIELRFRARVEDV